MRLRQGRVVVRHPWLCLPLYDERPVSVNRTTRCTCADVGRVGVARKY